MLTPGPESQGDLLQEQLELDLRNLTRFYTIFDVNSIRW